MNGRESLHVRYRFQREDILDTSFMYLIYQVKYIRYQRPHTLHCGQRRRAVQSSKIINSDVAVFGFSLDQKELWMLETAVAKTDQKA